MDPLIAGIDLAGGSYIFLGFAVLMVFVLIYSFYTRTGSGINQRPSDGRGEAPGASGESHISTNDPGVERTLGTHGTK